MEGDFQSWLNTMAPYVLAAANMGLFLWVKVDVKEIAVNTNSMKDALVASTAKASNLEGEKRGLAIAAEVQEKKDAS